MPLSKVTPDMIDTTGASVGHTLVFNGTVFAPAASSTGARQNTQTANTSSGTNTYNFTFPWVIGQCYIEYLNNTVTNNNTAVVVAAGWVNMRSYSGTKTDNITSRYSQLMGIVGATGDVGFFVCDRGTSGTVLTVKQCVTTPSGQSSKPWITTGGLQTYSNITWNNSYSLRVTAYEDIQS